MIDFERTHSRSEDPDTSKRAAKSAAKRAPSQIIKLLRAYAAKGEPLIDEEAWALTDIPERASGWRRCSDARARGWITPAFVAEGVAVEHRSSDGEWCRACVITEAGRAELRRIDGL